jgi:hypothetical protein
LKFHSQIAKEDGPKKEWFGPSASHFEIDGSIKGDVNKKASPSAGSREVFCLDIQPTADMPLDRSRGFALACSSVPLGFIFSW